MFLYNDLMKKSLVATLFIPIILFISPFFFTESLALAATPADGIVSLSGCSGPDCTACNVVDMVNGGITWLIGILFVVFAVIMVIAGVGLVTSGGNQSALESAKSKFTNAIIGLIIILSAWLIVDTLMRGLVGNDGKLKAEGTVTGWLFWADVECQRVITPEYESLEVVINDYGPGGIYGLEGGETFPTDPGADGEFTYDSGIAAQSAHASPALNNMLNCIASKVPASVGRVSSISDSRIVNGTKTFAQCVLGGCAHTANSRHYGGATCTGSSYAVDFGDETNVGVICGAANSCGSVNSCSIHDGNHVHLDLPLSC